MMTLDHLIVPISNSERSVAFYRDIVGLDFLGHKGPFDVFRVNEHLTLDLMETADSCVLHLAFSVDASTFNDLQARLINAEVPIGSDVFERDGMVGSNADGARGQARMFYFYDPDGHNLEARLYP